MRYRGFNIASCPDCGIIRDDDKTGKSKICNGYFCQITIDDMTDIDSFTVACGYEMPDLSGESLDNAIRKYVDDNIYALREVVKEEETNRLKILLSRALPLLESSEYESLYEILSEKVYMSDIEIWNFCHCDDVDKSAIATAIAEYLIDIGTETTTTGNWHIGFEEINKRFQIELPEDQEMLNAIENALDRTVVAEVDTTSDFNLNFYSEYCPNYKGEPEYQESDEDEAPTVSM